MQAVHRASFPIMGTTASVHVNDEITATAFDDVVSEVRNELTRLEGMFSVFRETSEISRINAGTLHHLDASPEVSAVLDACAWLEQASDGAFSIRRSRTASDINPSGFVKGWAGERSSTIMSSAGLQHWYVGIGGDFVLRGGLSDAQSWSIGIADPRDATQLVATVDVVDGAIATSGSAERGTHIWDPRTGAPADEFLSVTVTGPSLTWADAYATTVCVMGEPGLEWIAQFGSYDVMPVRRND
jgi:thiamine biosynthesis lipoprotein